MPTRVVETNWLGANNLYPNLINVIASHATLTVDLRNTDERTLQRAEK